MYSNVLLEICRERPVDIVQVHNVINTLTILPKNAYIQTINKRDRYINSSLMYAVMNNNYDLTQLLLENNADPNLINMYEQSTIIHACSNKNVKMLELLIEYKADINLKDIDRLTPINRLCQEYKPSKITKTMIKILLKQPNIDLSSTNRGECNTPLLHAVINNDFKLMVSLLNVMLKQSNYSTINDSYNRQGDNLVNITSQKIKSKIFKYIVQNHLKYGINLKSTRKDIVLDAFRDENVFTIKLLINNKFRLTGNLLYELSDPYYSRQRNQVQLCLKYHGEIFTKRSLNVIFRVNCTSKITTFIFILQTLI